MLVSVIPFALIALGGWLTWWGVRRRRGRSALPQHWNRVTGVVVDVGEVGRREPRIEYRAPGGRRLRIPGPSSVTYTMGQQVAVLIDPLDPSRARLDVTEREAELVVTILLVTGSIVLVIGLVTGVVLM